MEVIQKHTRHGHRESHRSEYEIINEILKFVSSPDTSTSLDRNRCKPIDIVYDCCLTWHQFQRYRSLLLRLNLVNCIQADGHQSYAITEKGLQYLRLFAELQAEMKPLDDFHSANK